MTSETLIKAVVTTAEVMGTELSVDGARLMCEELSAYPEPMVMASLSRCRRELRTKLILADILSRLDDGRPGPQEAWAMVPLDEAITAVMTTEIATAWGVANGLLQSGDAVAARMAFLEVYQREVTKARDERRPVKWFASLGHDKNGREQALIDAVEKGRISQQYAIRLIPDLTFAPSFPRQGEHKQIGELIGFIAEREAARTMLTAPQNAKPSEAIEERIAIQAEDA